MIGGTSSIETTIDTDEECDLKIIINLDVNRAGEWEINSIEREDDGTQFILTSDLIAQLTNEVNERFDEVEEDLEGSYADYRYEQYRDEREMET